jgi:hypothetical protein
VVLGAATVYILEQGREPSGGSTMSEEP